MGKGDRKTAKGKRYISSYGNARPKAVAKASRRAGGQGCQGVGQGARPQGGQEGGGEGRLSRRPRRKADPEAPPRGASVLRGAGCGAGGLSRAVARPRAPSAPGCRRASTPVRL